MTSSGNPLADELNNYPPPTPEGEIIIQGRGARIGANGLNHEIQTFRKALEVFSGLLSKKKTRLICRGTECYTDGNLIVIPDLSILDRKGMTPEEQRRAAEFLEAIRGFVSHEVGHVVYTDFNELKKRQFANRSKMHQMVWNCIEDAFIEKKMKELWAGVAVDLTNKSEWALRKLVEPDRWSRLPPVAKILTCFLDIADRNGKYQKSWYFKGLHPLYQKVLEELKPEIMACVRAQSTKECYDIAEQVIVKLNLVNNAQSSFQQIVQEEAKKLQKQQQENDNEEELEQLEVGSAAGDEDDDSEGDDGEDHDPSEAGGRGGDDEESSDDDGDDDGDGGELDDGDSGEDADGEDDGTDGDDAEGNGDGADGDGEEGDEEEGDQGSGDADGESDDGEDGEGGSGGDGDDETDGLDTGDGSSEDEEGGDYAASTEEKEQKSTKGGGGDPNSKTAANPIRPNDLWGFDELQSQNNAGNDLDPYSIESLIKDEATTQLSNNGSSGDSYRVFSDEWDKVGHIDDLMPMLMPNYAIDETRERAVYEGMSRKADAHIGVMKRKLQSILTTQSKPRHMRNLEDGDLDFTNLYKFALKDTDDSGRVFKKTTYTFNNNEVCVALCVNESGSMSSGSYIECGVVDPAAPKDPYGRAKKVPTDPKCVARGSCTGHGYVSRMELARQVALIFGETLGALNVPFRVVGHTAEPTAACDMYGTTAPNKKSIVPINRQQLHHYTRLGALVMSEYKGWEERWNAVKHKTVRMQPRSNTYDGEALRRMAEDIAVRREKRKVIFMLDDGIPEPSDFNAFQHRQYLKDIVKSVTASGIEVICLSMQAPQAREYYPNCIVINEVAETPLLAATELKRILLGAMKRNGA